ncbi:uncharacterized protein JN550_003116 [Neoarthrinium moseri]|uniref:uncharacterized protein n=1 Tax=Neoarthrinium moseri TaxID=1658444 RepID=UPI001FDD5AFD|nr:uncharacterized protein JN550_003116 [Neoarthrinium moseri]KAI1873847.1 hypothetical protein JN550_003116 [Neoarthrinium moseri]
MVRASGYLGGHHIKAAVESGFKVRAVARSKSSAQKIQAYFPHYMGQLSYIIVPDITKVDAYEQAFSDVTGIMHSASPFLLGPKDIIKGLLEPAIHGSIAILEAA